MNTLGYILVFTFLGSIGALAGGLILLMREKIALKVSHLLASFAAGTLLGTAFFDLLPEAAHEADGKGMTLDAIFTWTLVGIILFFIIERFIHWFHHHEEHHHADEEGHLHKEAKATVPLVIIGDSVHNFLDGVVIAATFMTNIQLGIITALAVFTHEIPQEIGDFGILLHKGLRKREIVRVNLLSAAVSIAGALLTYTVGGFLLNFIPAILALTAGFFIYIAASDLIPEIHYETRKGYAQIETALLLVGILVVLISVSLIGHGE